MVDDSDQSHEPIPEGRHSAGVSFSGFWSNLLSRLKRFVSEWGEEDVIRIDDESRIVRANLLTLQLEDRFELFWIEESTQEIEEEMDEDSIVGDELFSELLAAEEEWIRLQQIRDQYRKDND
ncbi:hypothetical protein [Endozoicomonas arenosclerae]|uniref:hypothetical protein n=1 Tax=Endozoicomonas arenosclerae TaxID=1633495 RepID=UPI0007819EE4|nr:hypothetical protein [Endozoicomonas arenosclerae]